MKALPDITEVESITPLPAPLKVTLLGIVVMSRSSEVASSTVVVSAMKSRDEVMLLKYTAMAANGVEYWESASVISTESFVFSDVRDIVVWSLEVVGLNSCKN